MKQILVHEPGGPEQLTLADVPTPDPPAGHVRVAIQASGVNFLDVYFRTGLYKSDRPITLGSEAAGTIAAVGDGVTGLSIGDRVAYTMHRGTYAEAHIVPARLIVKVPETLALDRAAAVLLQGTTAHYLTRSTFPLKKEHVCLVHAAAGGAGGLVVQMAKAAGARVIGTVSTQAKAEEILGLGADHAIIYTEQDFEAETMRLTEGRGVDVVYDSVGKTTFDKSLAVLKPRGTLALFGQSSGAVAPVDPLALNAKSLFLTRPSLGHYMATPEEINWRAGEVFDLVASSRLKVRVERTYPLAEAAQAHRDLESRRTSGKLLLAVS